jgi:formylglycine-generating enzyme required for sulfatase activity
MGSPAYEKERGEDEIPHRVKITKAFYMGITEVTQREYKRVMLANPSRHMNISEVVPIVNGRVMDAYPNRSLASEHPVNRVSWNDAMEFCRKLSAFPAEKSAGHRYRLPTEAEWEYACRAGTTTAYGFGDDDSQLAKFAWFQDNSAAITRPVGGKKPNAWSLYGMHGNVYEWCQDWYGIYPTDETTDPIGTADPTLRRRVVRGGSTESIAHACRSAFRSFDTSGPDFPGWHFPGFRVVITLVK